MMLSCPSCGNLIIIQLGPLHRDRSVQGSGTCKTCRAVYAVDVKELKATELAREELEARRNRTSHIGEPGRT